MPKVPTNITDLVGRTPILELTRLNIGTDVELFAKIEAFNPGAASRTASAWR